MAPSTASAARETPAVTFTPEKSTTPSRTRGRMDLPRLGAPATSCAVRIYVVGGMSTKEPLTSAGTYNAATADHRTIVAVMKTGRLSPGLVGYRNKIYAIDILCLSNLYVISTIPRFASGDPDQRKGIEGQDGDYTTGRQGIRR